MFDPRGSGRLAPHSLGNQGEGSDWRDGYDPPACSCTPDACLDSCEATGCAGYTLALRESSGLRWAFTPDECPKRQEITNV